MGEVERSPGLATKRSGIKGLFGLGKTKKEKIDKALQKWGLNQQDIAVANEPKQEQPKK
jgi:hypothetical protein